MQVTLRGLQTELRISTISIGPTNNGIVNLFRCVSCGGAVLQYEGVITKIYPMIEPMANAKVISKCKVCGELYTFYFHEAKGEKPTKVILRATGNPYAPCMFVCYICRRPLFNFDMNHIHLSDVAFPYYYKCTTYDCPAEYNFIDVL